MTAFMFSDSNWIFSVSIGIVLALFLIELLGTVFGLRFLLLFDDFSPVEVDADIENDTGVSPLLSWLCLDRLPLMVWLVLLLTLFGLSGYLTTFLSQSFFSSTITPAINVPIALIIAVIATGRLGCVIALKLTKHESSGASH